MKRRLRKSKHNKDSPNLASRQDSVPSIPSIQATDSNLELAIHSERTTVLCPFCQRSFHATNSLKRHMIDSYTITRRFISELSRDKRRVSTPSKILSDLSYSLNSYLLDYYDSEFSYLIRCILSETLDEPVVSFKQVLEFDLDSILTGIELYIYGSYDTGIKLPSSDLDLSLIVDPVLNAFKTNEIYEECIEILGESDTDKIGTEIIFSKIIHHLRFLGITQIHTRTHARIPILRFISNTDKPIQVDLSLNSQLPIHNSRLIKTYCSIDNRVKDLGILIKHFVNHRNIADATSGTLTSYTYLLLMIHFLQKRPIPILPNLQEYGQSNIIQGYECRFDQEYERYIEYAKRNTETLAELFYEFVKFYGDFEWDRFGIRIKDGSYVEREIDDSLPLIYDPFETGRSLGRVCSKIGFDRIVYEFKRACKMMREEKKVYYEVGY
jgi:DNA polymerase sigma